MVDMDTKIRYCAQFIARSGCRVPCDRPCVGAFYCSLHGGRDVHSVLKIRGNSLLTSSTHKQTEPFPIG